MGKFRDLTELKFGRLTVKERALAFEQNRLLQGKSKDTYWLCTCDCGNDDVKPKRAADLILGKVVSCGCVRNEAIRAYASNMSNNGNSILEHVTENNLLHIIDFDKNNEEGLDLSKISKKSKIKIWVKCEKTEYHPSYKITPKNLSNGIRCPYCKGNKVCLEDSVGYIYPNIIAIWSNKNNKTPYEYTEGNNTKKIIFKCNECGEERCRTIYSEIKAGFRCGACATMTRGEEEVRDALINHNIQYISQYRFKDCKHKNTLAFDFYLPQFNTCIEYDGQQHFEPVRFNGISASKAEKIFNINKVRDEIKTRYCSENDIKLIRIPYWEFDNIGQIIEDKLLYTN